jgi:hypothetical protein
MPVDKTQNLDALAKALVEAARNLRTARLDVDRIANASGALTAAVEAIGERAASSAENHDSQDVRPVLAPMRLLAEELAENSRKVDTVLKKLGEDLLRAAQTIG